MPYAKSKKNDIFISYTHDDDIEGWVKHFARLLERKLNKQLKVLEHGQNADVKVFTDASLTPSGALRARLEDELMDSALLLVILSESYLVSEWCRKEGEIFIRHLKGHRELTLFIAEKDKTDRDTWPDYLKDDCDSALLSMIFYEEKDVGRYRPIPIIDRTGAFNSEAGYLMEDFCRPICDALQNQNKVLPIRTGGASKRVFLALCPLPQGEACNHMNTIRERLVQLNDVELVPPLDPQHFANSLAERLANCDLFVQILDDQKGYYLSDRESGFVGHQFEAARSQGVRILQWKVPGLARIKMQDDAYHRFLAELKPAGEPGGTLVAGESPDDLFVAIQAALTTEPIPANTGDIKSIRVEIRSLREDREEAVKVGMAIRERSFIWNKGKGGERIRIRPVVLYDGATAEEIDLLAKLSKGTVIVYAKNFQWVDYHEEKVSSEANRVGRIAICDPWPKDAEFLALRQIKMFSKANSAERDKEIDDFLEELAGALTRDG